MIKKISIIVLSILLLVFIGLAIRQLIKYKREPLANIDVDSSFVVESSAFKNNEFIPKKNAVKGSDLSIPLTFKNIVHEAKSIAIIMDDPDAPGIDNFTHWVIWNIPANFNSIPEGIHQGMNVASLGNACQGKNGFGKVGYNGPNPPSGTHTYRIRVYVLDTLIDLRPGSSKTSLENKLVNHVLQYGLLKGKYSNV